MRPRAGGACAAGLLPHAAAAIRPFRDPLADSLGYGLTAGVSPPRRRFAPTLMCTAKRGYGPTTLASPPRPNSSARLSTAARATLMCTAKRLRSYHLRFAPKTQLVGTPLHRPDDPPDVL